MEQTFQIVRYDPPLITIRFSPPVEIDGAQFLVPQAMIFSHFKPISSKACKGIYANEIVFEAKQ